MIAVSEPLGEYLERRIDELKFERAKKQGTDYENVLDARVNELSVLRRKIREDKISLNSGE